MKLLIVNTSAEIDAETEAAINKLIEASTESKVINTRELNISHCIGCYTCMLNNPGICCLKDDHKILAQLYPKSDVVVFIADTAFDFIDYKMKKIVDRMFPYVSILTHFKEGEIRHVPRYKRSLNIVLLYKGHANVDLLEKWFHRFAINMSGKSLGVYKIEDYMEAYLCISSL